MSKIDNTEFSVSENRMWEVVEKDHDKTGYLIAKKIYRFWKINDGWKFSVTDCLTNDPIVTISLPKEAVDILIKETIKKELKE